MAQSSQQQQDNSLAAIWIIAGAFIVALIIWYLFHVEIVAIVIKIRELEVAAISVFTNKLAPLQHSLVNMGHAPGDVTIEELVEVSRTIGSYLSIPFGIILAILGIMLYMGNSINRYRSTLSMQNLVDSEKINWLQITPVAKLDLVKQDIDKGKWAMAQTPMQFCKKHRLFAESHDPSKFDPRIKQTATVLTEQTQAVLAGQIGRPWQDVNVLSVHRKALLAVFAARANGDRDKAAKLLQHISASTESGRLNFEGSETLLQKHLNSRLVQTVIARHAYELTVLASMIELARTDGVLATADFLWLKPLDRPLWYMMNSVGRQTPYVEVGGPFAHWLAEKALGRRLSVPMVEEAVKAVEAAMELVIYNPEGND